MRILPANSWLRRSLVAIGVAATASGLIRAQEPKPVPPSSETPAAAPTAPATQPGTPTATSPAAPGLPGRMPPTAAEPPPQPSGLPIPLPATRRNDEAIAPPGSPPRRGRPIPGSIFDPGASGPGIGASGREQFLGGALDPRSGWPFVFLDHYMPRPDRMEAVWIVQTRACPQDRMGTDPWPCLRVLHVDSQGDFVETGPDGLLAQAAAGRPVFIQVQGSLTTPDIAIGGLLWSRSWLQHHRSLPPDAVIVAFDWPSERVYNNDYRDINEKGRRAYVAAYHLARFLQGFPPNTRIGLLGQSYGGRVVPSALHLLGGGCLNSQDHDAPVRLPMLRNDLHIRAVVLAGASDHDWLNPGERLDHALDGCEAFLNLYNHRDEALRYYAMLIRSGHHQALGKVGLTNKDLRRLGARAALYSEYDVHDELGREHSLLDAVANPVVARHISTYLVGARSGPAAHPTPARADRWLGILRTECRERTTQQAGYGQLNSGAVLPETGRASRWLHKIRATTWGTDIRKAVSRSCNLF